MFRAGEAPFERRETRRADVALNAVLSAHNVSYRIGSDIFLEDINVELQAGAVHALIGPNGAGKSTLLGVLAGDVDATAGELKLFGRPLNGYSMRDLALLRAVMPQDVVMALAFTAEEVVAMGRYPHIVAKDSCKSRADRPNDTARSLGPKLDGSDDHETVIIRSMEATESHHLRDRLYPTLSGGEQARVTMARVLAQQTPVVFLDEPTASLDPRHQHLVMHLARGIARDGGTVLAVLHDMNLAATYADDVILVSSGRIRAQGAPSDVLRPDILEDVFQAKFHVTKHPLLPCPLVLSLPHDS